MTEPIWIVVTSAREGLDLVEGLARRGVQATLVDGPAGCRVRLASSRHGPAALMHETAAVLERTRAGARSEAA